MKAADEPPKQQEEEPQKPRPVFPIWNENGIVVDDENVEAFAGGKTITSNKNADSATYGRTDSVDAAANAISAKLSKMSLQDRMQGIHELHGVADFEDETPEMLQSKLKEMTRVADSFDNDFDVAGSGTNERTLGYRKAKELGSQYVEKTKLLCLRADYYDCQKAAARLVSFFSFKQQLFGESALGRDITLDDFDDSDRTAMQNGLCQLLPERDRAGRAVILGVGVRAPESTMETICRSMYYVFMAAIRDEEIQKRGIVFIYYLIGQTKFRTDRPFKVANLFWLLPIRLVAMHLCGNHVLHSEIASRISGHLEGHYLCRFRFHNGSHLECMYSLMTFGISKDAWPFREDDSGEMNLDCVRRWLATQRNREKTQRSKPPVTYVSSSSTSAGMPSCSSSSSSSLETSVSSASCLSSFQQRKEVAAPGPMDIVLGRGKKSKSSAGYLRLRNLVEDHCDAYDNSERYDKVVVVDFILKDLRQSGCRFVRITPEGLTEATPEVAREKVAHAFRDTRRSRRGGRNANSNGMNTATNTTSLETLSSNKTAVKRVLSET